MLTGMLAAENVFGANHNLWEINEEGEYLEEEKAVEVGERVRKSVLKQTFARMDKFAFASASGSVSGLFFFLATIWLVIKGGDIVGPNLQLCTCNSTDSAYRKLQIRVDLFGSAASNA